MEHCRRHDDPNITAVVAPTPGTYAIALIDCFCLIGRVSRSSRLYNRIRNAGRLFYVNLIVSLGITEVTFRFTGIFASQGCLLDSISRLDNLRPHSFLVPTVTPFYSGLGLCRFDSLSSHSFRSLLSPDSDVLSVSVCVSPYMHAMHRRLEEMQPGIGLVKPIAFDIWCSHPLKTMSADGRCTSLRNACRYRCS